MNASVDTLDMILKRKHVDDKLNPSKRSKAKLTKRHSPCLNERSLYDFFPLASRKCLNTRKDMMLQCAASSSHLKSNHLPSTSDLSKQTTRLHVAAVTVNHETKTTPPLTLELGCEEDVSNVLHDDELRKPILKQMSRRFSLKGPSITNEEKESSPMTGRCLFGPVDHESLSNFLAGELKSMREKKKKRWSFDFETGLPADIGTEEGGLKWELVADTPAIYLPKTLSRCQHSAI